MSKLSQMFLDERGSLWIPSIECSRSCDAPLKTCVRVNVRWKEEEKGDRRGWTKTRKDAGGRIEHLQLNAQTQNSIIKASNIQSKDNFNCAGAQNDCTVYTNSTWRTWKPLRTSVTPGENCEGGGGNTGRWSHFDWHMPRLRRQLRSPLNDKLSST